MGEFVDQCMELGLVDRIADPSDGRARSVKFTPAGLTWLDAFRDAVNVAEREMRAQLGRELESATHPEDGNKTQREEHGRRTGCR